LRESKEAPPTLLDIHSELGNMYFQAMELAGNYAYAGRDIVMNQVLGIIVQSHL
jgi:tRNA-splicing ligase RtcB